MSPRVARGLHLAKRGKYQARGLHRAKKGSKSPVAEASPAAEASPSAEPSRVRRWGVRVAAGAGVLVVLAGGAVLLILTLGRPRITVEAAGEALFGVHLKGLGTHLSEVSATSAGQPVALVSQPGGVVPTHPLAQNQVVIVSAKATPPSWLRWLLGSGVSSTKTVRAPAAAPAADVAVASTPGRLPVRFDHPVSVVEYDPVGQPAHVVHLSRPSTVAYLAVSPGVAGGTLRVAAAPLPWEKLAPRASVLTWFDPPADGEPVALVSPAPGATTAAANGSISLTFDQPVAKVLGNSRPSLSPAVAGTWSQSGPDTLVFTPQGFGFGPGTAVTVSFNRPVAAVGSDSTGATPAQAMATSTSYRFSTAPASVVRMEQILAQLRYLPLNFVPAAGVKVPDTFAAEVASMSEPLPGTFTWRWASTPATLESQWTVGTPNELLDGALMAFQQAQGTYAGNQVDSDSFAQTADASMWNALLHAAAAGQLDPNPYAYVYVTQSLPETLTVWENGSVVLTSPCNTGIPVAPTADGTYPIYLRFSFNYMSGYNPDGSYYHDPVYWINYFNGGDAVHGFYRGSYGWPQSLGCVELPVSTAEVAFNELAIGDLVTVD
jgi:L,D-transpeptidase catalytic domain/Bacterial Ig-like domain